MLFSKVTSKIRGGFVVMILLPLGLGLAAWLGTVDLQNSLQVYADLGADRHGDE